MESPTLADWIAIVAQISTVPLALVMGFVSRSSEQLAGKAMRWGLLFCLPYFVEGGPGIIGAVITFPLMFVLLALAGYGIRRILARFGVMAAEPRSGHRI